MKKIRYWDWVTIWIIIIIFVVFSVFVGFGYIAIKAIGEIEKHGLKHIVEQIWEGEE